MAEVINTIGRRKTAVARVYMTLGNGEIKVNGRDYKEYFPTGPLQYIVNQAFAVANAEGKWDVKANLDGKKEGFLMRDPRMVERKKSGQPKARKRFQFSKR